MQQRLSRERINVCKRMKAGGTWRKYTYFLGFWVCFFFSFPVCDGVSCIDIEVLLRRILTHLLMPSEALCRFIQLGGNTVGVTENEETCQNLQTWIGLSSGLLIFRVPCWTHCHWFSQNLLSDSMLFSIFWINPTVPEMRYPELLTHFWQYWCSLTCLCHSTAVWKRKNSRNRIWIAVEVEGFLLPAVALNQATDGDEVPVAAALLARALQQC